MLSSGRGAPVVGAALGAVVGFAVVGPLVVGAALGEAVGAAVKATGNQIMASVIRQSTIWYFYDLAHLRNEASKQGP